MRIVKEIGALAISRLTDTGFHSVGKVAGLHLRISPTGAKSWIMRITIAKKRCDVGLGAYPAVSLDSARNKAQKLRDDVGKGINPMAAKKQAKELIVKEANAPTFEEYAKCYIERHAFAWKNPKSHLQWSNTLATYAYPYFGAKKIKDVTLGDVTTAIDAIWQTKTDTANKVKGRIAAILGDAMDSDVRLLGSFKEALERRFTRKTGKKRGQHPSIHHSKIGAFMGQLSAKGGNAARCLEFAILTAMRSNEVRGALWREVDLERKTWAIHGDDMKRDMPHVVPMSKQVIELLQAQPRGAEDDLIFPSPTGQKMSDMAMTKVIRDMGVSVIADGKERIVVPHGFRSTFRTWCEERTNYTKEEKELALAHKITDKVVAAYQRGDVLDKRKPLMQDWASRCYAPDNYSDNVIEFKPRKAA